MSDPLFLAACLSNVTFCQFGRSSGSKLFRAMGHPSRLLLHCTSLFVYCLSCKSSLLCFFLTHLRFSGRIVVIDDFHSHRVEQIQSMAEKRTSSEDSLETQAAPPVVASQPPNGGVKAWLQVLGSFILFFNTWSVSLAVLVASLLSTNSLRDPMTLRPGRWQQQSESCSARSMVISTTTSCNNC